MTALSALSTAQLRRALELKEKIETLETELNDILGTPVGLVKSVLLDAAADESARPQEEK